MFKRLLLMLAALAALVAVTLRMRRPTPVPQGPEGSWEPDERSAAS